MRKKRLTRDLFLKKIVQAGGFANITKNTAYVSNKKKIEFVCAKHGLFLQRADHFYEGSHCPKCGIAKNGNYIKKDTESFIKTSRNKHGDFYDYSLSEYTVKSNKIKIICPIHGVFEQVAGTHMRGSGCYDCNHVGPYKDNYIKNSNKRHNGLSNLYILKCFNGDEVFYKIGITNHKITKRYRKSSDMPYSYRVLLFKSMLASQAIDEEFYLKKSMNGFKYKPKIKFGGSARECFSKVYFKGRIYE